MIRLKPVHFSTDTPGHLLLHPQPVLDEGEVHLWWAFLPDFFPQVDEFSRLLPEEEVEKSRQYRFEKDRRGYIISQAVLRLLLGKYQNIDPGEVLFTQEGFGKPCVSAGYQGKQLQFNLSHARDVVVYALTVSMEIGVDVEFVREFEEMEHIVENHFTQQEKRILAGLMADQKLEAFYVLWTGKEAYLKAVGSGLSLPLDSVTVPFPVRENEVRHFQDDRSDCWSFFTFRLLENYLGTVVLRGETWRMLT